VLTVPSQLSKTILNPKCSDKDPVLSCLKKMQHLLDKKKKIKTKAREMFTISVYHTENAEICPITFPVT